MKPKNDWNSKWYLLAGGLFLVAAGLSNNLLPAVPGLCLIVLAALTVRKK